jgi:hypothetical protein
VAQKVSVIMTDDLDGDSGEDVATRSFGLDGKTYSIELSDDNYEMLRMALQPFVAKARIGSRASAGRQVRSQASREESGQIRTWAMEAGLINSKRGRIPAEVKEKYFATHA